MLTVVRVSPSHSAFGAVAVLFDDYRAHYGWPPSPQLTHDWLHAQVTRQAMMVTAALRAGGACGFVAASVIPASLAFGTAWSVRDLYVAPPHRRSAVPPHPSSAGPRRAAPRLTAPARAAGPSSPAPGRSCRRESSPLGRSRWSRP